MNRTTSRPLAGLDPLLFRRVALPFVRDHDRVKSAAQADTHAAIHDAMGAERLPGGHNGISHHDTQRHKQNTPPERGSLTGRCGRLIVGTEFSVGKQAFKALFQQIVYRLSFQ